MANTANTGGGRRRGGSTAGHVVAVFFKVIGTLLLVGIVTGMIMASFAAVYIKNVIMPQTHMEITDYSMNMNLTSTIYYTDRNTGMRVESQTLHGEENRVWVPYDQIPQNLVNATIAIEDRRFREHNGVYWKRTAYGVFAMFTVTTPRTPRWSGTSTISTWARAATACPPRRATTSTRIWTS